MYKLKVRGGNPLRGTVPISGSKNAVLPILAATLLAEGPVTLRNVPMLSDVELMLDILDELGVATEVSGDVIHTEVVETHCSRASYELVSRMRASFCVLGPLVGRRKQAEVPLPGGCVIGQRPVGLHVKGLKALGADLSIAHGSILANAGDGLRGDSVYLGGPHGSSVTGTANVLMAAVLARGTTIIEQAACEPEVADLAKFLVAMGANIEGIGSPRLVIHGVEGLTGCEYSVIPDRVEAETYAIGAVLTRGDVTLDGVRAEDMSAVLEGLREAGATIERLEDERVRIIGPDHRPLPLDVSTHVYPGFPTDAQAQLMAMCAVADGISVITENIYPDRFMHVAELGRMGAQIRKAGNAAIIRGVERLSGAPVTASDLRAGAGLVLAGLAASGETEVFGVHHIDRGYEGLELKLQALGGDVERVEWQPRRRKGDRPLSRRVAA